MAYHIYQTEGIVLAGFPEGEASRYLQIFTEELGLVGASARSVRLEKSKLRYALQDYSLALVSLVRGKDVWRVVNAVPKANLYGDLPTKAKKAALVRVASLVRKLLAGEEGNPGLYALVRDAFAFLASEDMDRDAVVAFQLIAALRVLRTLGYIGEDPRLAPFAGEGWSAGLLASLAPEKKHAQQTIRRALSASHLS